VTRTPSNGAVLSGFEANSVLASNRRKTTSNQLFLVTRHSPLVTFQDLSFPGRHVSFVIGAPGSAGAFPAMTNEK
jgi:hypothetical protein